MHSSHKEQSYLILALESYTLVTLITPKLVPGLQFFWFALENSSGIWKL